MDDETLDMEILVTHRVSLVQNLQLDRTFIFDYLLSKSVIDKNDYDLVKSEKTREQKASKLLDIVETRGLEGLKHFTDALQLIHPVLYESLTGQKATIRSNPIVEALNSILGDDFRVLDQDLLSSHLRRVTDDLRDMTFRYEHLLKEDQELRKALKKANEKHDEAEERASVLAKLLEDAEAVICATQSSANLSLIQQYEALQKDRHDTKDFVIQLQMKLLQSQEEADRRSNELKACKAKSDELTEELSQVHQHYTIQRKEALRLSDKLKNQNQELTLCEKLKLQYREKQFQVSELKCLLEKNENELDEVKKWTEALTNRYDATVEKQDELYISQRAIEERALRIQSEVNELEIKNNRLTREVEEVRREKEKMEKEADVIRKQADAFKESHLQGVKKLDEANKCFAEQLQSKQQEVERATECTEHFEMLLKDTKAELQATKDEMSFIVEQNDELLRKLNQLGVDYQLLKSEVCNRDSDGDACADSVDNPVPQVDQDYQGKSGKTPSFMRPRSTNELINSVRRRFAKSPKVATSSPPRPVWRRSLSFDSWISTLTPAYKNLSAATKKSLSLERQNHLAHPLSYETLACMLDTEGKAEEPIHQIYSRERIAQHGRKFSSPLPLNVHEMKKFVASHEGISEDQDSNSGADLSDDNNDHKKEQQQMNKAGPSRLMSQGNTGVPSGFRPRCQVMVRSVRERRQRHSHAQSKKESKE